MCVCVCVCVCVCIHTYTCINTNCILQLKDLEVNLKNCKQGEVIGVFCSRNSHYDTDTLYLVRHKKVIKKIAIKVPKERYIIVDIYGQCACVKLLPLRDAPQFKKSKMIDKQIPG